MCDEKTNPPHLCQETIGLLRKVFDSLPFAVICKDYSTNVGTFTMWNRKAESLWGFSESEVLGKTDFDFFPDAVAESVRKQDLIAIKDLTEDILVEEKIASNASRKISVQMWRIPINGEDNEPRYLITVIKDTSHIKSMENELKTQQEKISESVHLAQQVRLVQEIAHQLNNPFAIILGRCSQLFKIMEQHSCPPEARALLESIADNVRLSAQSVDRLLHLTTKRGNAATVITAEPNASHSEKAILIHDFANLLAICMGKSNQMMRLIEGVETSPGQPQIHQKLTAVIDVLKRMEVTLDLESKRGL